MRDLVGAAAAAPGPAPAPPSAAGGAFLIAPCWLCFTCTWFFSNLSYLRKYWNSSIVVVVDKCMNLPEEQIVHIVIHLQQVCGEPIVVHLSYELDQPGLHGAAGAVQLLQQTAVLRVLLARLQLGQHVRQDGHVGLGHAQVRPDLLHRLGRHGLNCHNWN